MRRSCVALAAAACSGIALRAQSGPCVMASGLSIALEYRSPSRLPARQGLATASCATVPAAWES